MRSCLGCRGRFERGSLIRVVCDAEARVWVDRHLKAPGRGAHLCYARSCIEQAIKRNAFARAFGQRVQPISLEAFTAEVLEAIDLRIDDTLALARRAGYARSGNDVLEREMGRLSVLVMATDAAPASAEKLTRRAAALGVAVVEHHDRGHLGHSQGQLQRIAVGIIERGLAQRVLTEVERRHQVSVAA